MTIIIYKLIENGNIGELEYNIYRVYTISDHEVLARK